MNQENGYVLSVNISKKRAEKKHNVQKAYLKADYGIETDAHSGSWHRQVSLLSLSSFKKMQALGAAVEYGDFAENITIAGIDVSSLPLGTRIRIGEALLEVTQIGKECHNKGCPIKQQVGTCVMPLEGIFTRVLESGRVQSGDKVIVLEGKGENYKWEKTIGN